jgi:hypothetical protein
MPPAVNLDPYKEEIIGLAQDHSGEEIRSILLSNHGISVTSRTVNKRLQEWGARSSSHTINDIEQRVYDLHCLSLNTEEILLVLEKDGTPSSERTIRRIRKRRGI